jgi:hypothetical protein
MKLSLKPLTISTLAVGMLSTLAIASAQAVRVWPMEPPCSNSPQIW